MKIRQVDTKSKGLRDLLAGRTDTRLEMLRLFLEIVSAIQERFTVRGLAVTTAGDAIAANGLRGRSIRRGRIPDVFLSGISGSGSRFYIGSMKYENGNNPPACMDRVSRFEDPKIHNSPYLQLLQ